MVSLHPGNLKSKYISSGASIGTLNKCAPFAFLDPSIYSICPLPRIFLKTLDPGDQTSLSRIGCADIIMNVLLCFLLQLHITAFRRRYKSMFQFVIDTVLRICKQRPEFFLKVVALICLSNKIQESQAVLARCNSETTAELLQEDRQGFCRSQKTSKY